MTSNRFIAATIPIAIVLAVLASALPDEVAGDYAQIMHVAALVSAGALALWVSRGYRGDLQRAFLLLAGFLVLYAPTSSSWAVAQAADVFNGAFLRVLLGYQIFTYAFLLASSLFIVRLMDVKRLNATGWVVTVAVAALGVVFVATAWSEVSSFFDASVEAGLIYLLIRIFDSSVMIFLAPVIWLYAQNARARYQESATFTLVALGVVLSLVLAYVYELAKGDSLSEIADVEYQAGSVLDGLYLFGYLTIAVALFAHRKHQEWAYRQLDGQLV